METVCKSNSSSWNFANPTFPNLFSKENNDEQKNEEMDEKTEALVATVYQVRNLVV